MEENITYQNIYETCKQHMHSYVLVETTDGMKIDGIITGLDEENVYLAVPVNPYQESIEQNPNQFGPYPDPYYRPGSRFGYVPRRRFRRQIIPLALLAALSLLPWY